MLTVGTYLADRYEIVSKIGAGGMSDVYKAKDHVLGRFVAIKVLNYDMNLCYIDELLWHLNWTGDLEYARRMWPVLTRHLAWEKLNYDPDNDGLYDAYACT